MKMSIKKCIASVVLASLIGEVFTPLASYALTSGPAQPEFSSFEPVNTTDMVNEFTGSFTYNLPVLNIPGPNGGGYALSLSYHSGASIEEEASWVGYGWTLNPGAIIRNKRGFPDDYNGASVKYWNKVPSNWTASVGGTASLEIFSVDGLSTTGNASIRYNNYKGFSTVVGFDAGYKGVISLGYSLTDGDGSFSFGINPGEVLQELNALSKADESPAPSKSPLVRAIQESLKEAKAKIARDDFKAGALYRIGSYFSGIYSFEERQRATNITEYEGRSVDFSVGPHITPTTLPIGVELGLKGNYTEQWNRYESESIPCYGYMYSGNGDNESGNLMDYYSEKESVYSKRDYFLSIPFSNADQFMVTGEGIGGGFRMHSRRPGHFRPNSRTSKTRLGHLGFAVHTGPLNIGGGLNVGLGSHTLKAGKWSDASGYTFPDAGAADEQYFFRFNNDLGGKVEYTMNLDALKASLVVAGSGINPVLDEGGLGLLNNGNRSGRSAYIGYHTNMEMLKVADPGCDAGRRPGILYNAYDKYLAADTHVTRSTGDIQNGIGEFEVTNASGMRYAYGLPVYSRKEKNLQYGLDGTPGSSVEQNYLVKRELTTSNAEVIVGEERDAPYASMYLLTEITTPDYVDRTNNGPTSDDFGGYTKFTYARTAGTNNKSGDAGEWYKWRIPYTGLLYERRSLSDPMDDVGGMISGEKEMYYLDKIETKTHVAHFIRSQRQDAFQANHNEGDAAAGELEELDSTMNRSYKLDKIELYAKDSLGGAGKLLQTVHFGYTYQLCKNLPNAAVIDCDALEGEEKENCEEGDRYGKLTLRKVWFEYNGVVGAKIAPYVFGYEYRESGDYADLPADVERMYDPIIRYGDSVTVPAQNPDYNQFNLDRWGNYQYEGGNEHARFRKWVDQTPNRSEFDPAAWQLKTIRMPSGGEMHVQYEQNDYRFVQNRPAMAMVSIKPEGPSIPGDGKYYLKVKDDLGIKDDYSPGGNANDPELKALRTLIHEQFVARKEKIYFKFLFPLHGTTANFQNCISEYITGYVDVAEVGLDDGGIFIQIGDANESYDSPKDVCLDFFNANRSGNLRFGVDCEASSAGISNDMDVDELLLALLSKIGSTVLFNSLNCQASYIECPESYLRIPMTRAKLGGGIRVKRLLMYDHGAEDGEGHASLYGSEYLYQDEAGASSGVATNEPSTGREENSLIKYLRKRAAQGAIEQIIAGQDKEQFEGPIGESLLPAASVGYSRIITKNIFNGATNPGFKITEFHTAKDFPFDQEDVNSNIPGRTIAWTNIDPEEPWAPTIPFGPLTFRKANSWLTQGYRFVINNMHGQLKSMYSYAGDYRDKNAVLVSGQQHEYFAPGEPVPMMYGIDDIRPEHPGKEEEVVFESREIEDVLSNGKGEIDASLGIVGIFPIPFLSGFPTITYMEHKLRMHVTSKVIRFPAIQKGTTVFRDGVWHTTRHLGFDPATGVPILTRTRDGYHDLALQLSPTGHDGSYYSYSMPAYQQYPAMGQRGVSERAILKSQSGVLIEKWYDSSHYLNFRFQQPGIASSILSQLTSGDLVRLHSSVAYRGLYQVGKIVGNKVELIPTSIDVGITAAPENVDIEIIRSGRTNQLTASAASITTYGAMPTITDFPVD